MAEAGQHTFEELKGMTVAQLREVAKEQDSEALKGYSTMRKEVLLGALCEALGIEQHAHHEVVGVDKASIKARIKSLKGERESALAAGDSKLLKRVRRRIRRLKRSLRRATV